MARLLIVDDEPDILLLLRLSLEAAGHEVVMAADGEVALARVASDTPDAVVLDVMMPVLDGWAVLEALGALEAPPPVVVVSAKTAGSDVAHALALGACDYVTKPFDPQTLVAAVGGALARDEASREAHRQLVLQRATGGR